MIVPESGPECPNCIQLFITCAVTVLAYHDRMYSRCGTGGHYQIDRNKDIHLSFFQVLALSPNNQMHSLVDSHTLFISLLSL